jgi:preprotein translocase subunit YajC
MTESMIVFAAAAAAAPGEQPSPILQFLPLAFLLMIFYFMLVRPEQKKRKEHADMLAKLDKNDEVVTSGGIHATVVSVGDKTAMIRIADNVKVEIEKGSITAVTKSRQA